MAHEKNSGEIELKAKIEELSSLKFGDLKESSRETEGITLQGLFYNYFEPCSRLFLF